MSTTRPGRLSAPRRRRRPALHLTLAALCLLPLCPLPRCGAKGATRAAALPVRQFDNTTLFALMQASLAQAQATYLVALDAQFSAAARSLGDAGSQQILSRLETLQREFNGGRDRQMAALDARRAAINNRINAHRQAQSDFNSRVDALERQRTDYNNYLSQVQAETARVRNEVDAVLPSINQKLQALIETNNRAAQAQNALQTLRASVEAGTYPGLQQVQRLTEQYNGWFDALRAEVEREGNAIEAQVNSYNTWLRSQQEFLQNFAREVNHYVDQYDAYVPTYNNHLTAYKRAVEEHNSLVQRWNGGERTQAVRNRIDALKAEIPRLEAEHNRAATRIRQLEGDAVKHKQDFETHKRRIETEMNERATALERRQAQFTRRVQDATQEAERRKAAVEREAEAVMAKLEAEAAGHNRRVEEALASLEAEWGGDFAQVPDIVQAWGGGGATLEQAIFNLSRLKRPGKGDASLLGQLEGTLRFVHAKHTGLQVTSAALRQKREAYEAAERELQARKNTLDAETRNIEQESARFVEEERRVVAALEQRRLAVEGEQRALHEQLQGTLKDFGDLFELRKAALSQESQLLNLLVSPPGAESAARMETAAARHAELHARVAAAAAPFAAALGDGAAAFLERYPLLNSVRGRSRAIGGVASPGGARLTWQTYAGETVTEISEINDPAAKRDFVDAWFLALRDNGVVGHDFPTPAARPQQLTPVELQSFWQGLFQSVFDSKAALFKVSLEGSGAHALQAALPYPEGSVATDYWINSDGTLASAGPF